MLYSAEETDLDLRITVQNDECILAGQVIGKVALEAMLRFQVRRDRSEASLNELCEFTLPAIPVGNYSLRVRMLDR